jgi:hypothetical protein
MLPLQRHTRCSHAKPNKTTTTTTTNSPPNHQSPTNHTNKQVMQEVQAFLRMLGEVYGIFGLDYSMALSTRCAV